MSKEEVFGLMENVDSVEDVNMESEIDMEEAELNMAIELKAEENGVDNPDQQKNMEDSSNLDQLGQAAEDRLAKIRALIEERRNGLMPKYYSEHTDEAKEKQRADKLSVLGELQAAQDEVDKVTAQAHAEKLRVLSSEKKPDYDIPVKFEHACEVDDTGIIKRDRSEYVYMFKANMRRTALATLEMCRVVYEAEKTLSDSDFDEFCKQINYKSDSSTIRKFTTIGKVYPRFIQYAEQLPAAWTSIYALTQIPADDFERCIAGGYALNRLTGGEIDELVKKTRNINNSVSPFKQDKKAFQFAVATVFFTKQVDDTDFRLLQKAFDEIGSRLPVKLVVKKETTEYFAKRRAQRYEKLKVEAKDVMVRPEKWDYGLAANNVYEDARPELKVAS